LEPMNPAPPVTKIIEIPQARYETSANPSFYVTAAPYHAKWPPRFRF
jgi:hypothetical protein